MTGSIPPALRVDGVSKKFCRSLRRSLRYGLVDVALELGGRGGGDRPLRKDEFWAVRNVSFDLHPGDCLGLIGHNGAGKTTLLRMLAGLIKPDGGCIESRGRIAAMIALGAGFNPVLSGRENIHVNGVLLGMSSAEIDRKLDWIIDFSGLAEFIDAPVQSYSSGMSVRLGFAIAIATQPDVLILDEVLAVGDMEFRAKCQAQLNALRDAGGALILVSHSMEQIAHHCDRAILMGAGEVLADGVPTMVIERYFEHPGRPRHAPGTQALPAEHPKLEASPHYNPGETRWGDGRATIRDIELLQAGHAWPALLLPGLPVTIDVHARFDAEVEHPIFGLTIKNDAGAEIFHTNSRTLALANAGPRHPNDTVHVAFEIDPFLADGDYTLSLGIACEEAGGIVPLDRRYDCARIRVSTPALRDGEPDLRPRMRLSTSQ